MRCLNVTILALMLSNPMLADGQQVVKIRTGPDGARIVRIPDSLTPHCINYTKDTVSIELRRMVTDNQKGWFTKDKDHGALVKTSVTGKTGDTNGPAVSFPTLSKVTVQEYAKGQVLLPLEFPVVDRLKLTQQKDTYDGLAMDVSIIREKGKSKWGAALEAMSENMSKLPIPASPYSTAASELLKFANSAVDKSLSESNSPDHLSFAQIRLRFGSTDPKNIQDCGSDDEQTGTIAVIEAGGTPGPGYISSLNDIDSGKACLATKAKPGFTMLVKQKDSSAGNCPTDLNQYEVLTNDYLMFLISYERLASVGIAQGTKAESDILARCKINGLNRTACLEEKKRVW